MTIDLEEITSTNARVDLTESELFPSEVDDDNLPSSQVGNESVSRIIVDFCQDNNAEAHKAGGVWPDNGPEVIDLCHNDTSDAIDLCQDDDPEDTNMHTVQVDSELINGDDDIPCSQNIQRVSTPTCYADNVQVQEIQNVDYPEDTNMHTIQVDSELINGDDDITCSQNIQRVSTPTCYADNVQVQEIQNVDFTSDLATVVIQNELPIPGDFSKIVSITPLASFKTSEDVISTLGVDDIHSIIEEVVGRNVSNSNTSSKILSKSNQNDEEIHLEQQTTVLGSLPHKVSSFPLFAIDKY
jgi:hypothetical protein